MNGKTLYNPEIEKWYFCRMKRQCQPRNMERCFQERAVLGSPM